MLPLLLLLACTDTPSLDDTAVAEPDLQPLFSFVVIADPHITGNAEHSTRLQAAIAWIEANREARGIEVVVIVGDIGWGEGLQASKSMLDTLTMPYLPVLGDNEVHFDTGEPFEQTFGPHIQATATERGPVQVHNPVHDRPSWMQNYAFDHGGVHFVALDWVSRSDNNLLSELAELNDFEGGTLPWLGNHTAGELDSPANDILLFSHHPMHLGSFNLAQLDAIAAITGPIEGRVAANWAGHYHLNFEETVQEGGYDVFVTDATWDDDNTVRVVQVSGNGTRYAYEQELVIVE